MSHPLLNEIVQKLEYIIKVLDGLKKEAQQYLSLEEAAKYLGISKSTLYKYTSGGQITHYKPKGKLIHFHRVDLDNWINKNRNKSNDEL